MTLLICDNLFLASSCSLFLILSLTFSQISDETHVDIFRHRGNPFDVEINERCRFIPFNPEYEIEHIGH